VVEESERLALIDQLPRLFLSRLRRVRDEPRIEWILARAVLAARDARPRGSDVTESDRPAAAGLSGSIGDALLERCSRLSENAGRVCIGGRAFAWCSRPIRPAGRDATRDVFRVVSTRVPGSTTAEPVEDFDLPFFFFLFFFFFVFFFFFTGRESRAASRRWTVRADGLEIVKGPWRNPIWRHPCR